MLLAAVKVPSPLPRSTLTLKALAVTTSRLPSRSKSPTATERGPLPVAEVWAESNVPSPFPSSTLTELSPATARSGTVSLLKSAVTTAWGYEPTERLVTGLKLGRQRSSRTSTVGRCVTARSELRRPRLRWLRPVARAERRFCSQL